MMMRINGKLDEIQRFRAKDAEKEIQNVRRKAADEAELMAQVKAIKQARDSNVLK